MPLTIEQGYKIREEYSDIKEKAISQTCKFRRAFYYGDFELNSR